MRRTLRLAALPARRALANRLVPPRSATFRAIAASGRRSSPIAHLPLSVLAAAVSFRAHERLADRDRNSSGDAGGGDDGRRRDRARPSPRARAAPVLVDGARGAWEAGH